MRVSRILDQVTNVDSRVNVCRYPSRGCFPYAGAQSNMNARIIHKK